MYSIFLRLVAQLCDYIARAPSDSPSFGAWSILPFQYALYFRLCKVEIEFSLRM
jgi:hypothetical protein